MCVYVMNVCVCVCDECVCVINVSVMRRSADGKSGVEGESVDLGGRRIIKKKRKKEKRQRERKRDRDRERGT